MFTLINWLCIAGQEAEQLLLLLVQHQLGAARAARLRGRYSGWSARHELQLSQSELAPATQPRPELRGQGQEAEPPGGHPERRRRERRGQRRRDRDHRNQGDQRGERGQEESHLCRELGGGQGGSAGCQVGVVYWKQLKWIIALQTFPRKRVFLFQRFIDSSRGLSCNLFLTLRIRLQ